MHRTVLMECMKNDATLKRVLNGLIGPVLNVPLLVEMELNK